MCGLYFALLGEFCASVVTGTNQNCGNTLPLIRPCRLTVTLKTRWNLLAPVSSSEGCLSEPLSRIQAWQSRVSRPHPCPLASPRHPHLRLPRGARHMIRSLLRTWPCESFPSRPKVKQRRCVPQRRRWNREGTYVSMLMFRL